MDRTELVVEQCDEGERLVEQLQTDEFNIEAAAWIKTSDDGQWFLYLASKMVDEKGLAAAYRVVQAAIRQMSRRYLDPFDVKLVSASHPLVSDVQKIYERFPARIQTQFGGAQLGGMSIVEALIYPPSLPTKQKKRLVSQRPGAGKRVVKSER